MLNVLIGMACIAITLAVLFQEHYRQENQKKMKKYTDILERLLPKAFPQLFEEEQTEATGIVTGIPNGERATDMPDGIPAHLQGMPIEVLSQMGFGGPDLSELEYRQKLRSLTNAVLEGHNYQISFEDAQAKAVELILKFDAQNAAPLPSELSSLLPKTEIQNNVPNV